MIRWDFRIGDCTDDKIDRALRNRKRRIQITGYLIGRPSEVDVDRFSIDSDCHLNRNIVVGHAVTFEDIPGTVSTVREVCDLGFDAVS